MCGIIGYTGKKQCLPILLAGLASLEYRGYDSAGITVQGTKLVTVKSCGRLTELIRKLEGNSPNGTCGIGHTRWATHGEPSDCNAHPHTTPHLSLVHNGIIENEASLGTELAAQGYRFLSETDTEKAADLIDLCYTEARDPIQAIRKATGKLKGAYAFGMVFSDIPGKIFAVRRDSPLIVAVTEEGCYLASDVTAILPYAKQYFRPEEDMIAVLNGTAHTVQFFDRMGEEVTLPTETVHWNVKQAQKGGYPHFMLKEIHEEPDVIRHTVSAYLSNGLPLLGTALTDGGMPPNGRIHLVACGTAMHAGLYGKHLIEAWARIPAEVSLASEFRYRNPILSSDDWVILISQSGETSDTLAALRLAREAGAHTLGIINVPGSAMTREADEVIGTLAGPEVAVASTKAYHVQCAVLYLVAVRLALLCGKLTEEGGRYLCRLIQKGVPGTVTAALSLSDTVREAADAISGKEHLFFIGRNLDFALAAEASLKLKEISYLHSEAYAAGELKHGTISLITDDVPVIALLTSESVAEKMISGIREVLSRGADVTVFASEQIADRYEIPCRRLIRIPNPRGTEASELTAEWTDPASLFPTETLLQLLAYHVSDLRGLDVDKPRNLAKSVTVE